MRKRRGFYMSISNNSLSETITPAISIITPVYNVEKYLSKCITSILSQSFKNFELIIVNDGATDSSGKISDEFAKSDSRIRVIHKKNGGAPSARNAGLAEAIGEYFYFPDSDDWLEPTYLQSLYDVAVESKAKLIISGFVMEYFEHNIEHSYSVEPAQIIYSTQKEVRENLHNYFNNMMMAVPWNKLYRADFIRENGIYFPNLKWDDLHFNLDVIMNIDSVAISSSTGYHFFRSRQGSETTQVFDSMLYSKRKEQFEHIMEVYKYWEIDAEDVMRTLYGYYGSRLIQCIQEVAISQSNDKRKRIKDILDDNVNYTAIKNGRYESRLLGIVSLPVRTKNVVLCIITGKMIGFIKVHLTPLFYKLKSISVNKAAQL